MIAPVRAEDLRLTRRRLFTVLAAAGVSACAPDTGESAETEPQEEQRRAASPTPAGKKPSGRADRETEDNAAAAEEEPEPYEPLPGDVYRDAKRTGGRMAQALATYEAGEDLPVIVERAAAPTHPGFSVATATEAARPVHDPQAGSSGEVIYAQLGGLTPSGAVTSCSILVVVRQRLSRSDGTKAVLRRTMDVRLELRDGQWAVEQLGGAGGSPAPRPDQLSAPARAVVDHPRIDLSDSARWDIYRGQVDGRLLTTMAELAEQAPYAVTCLKSGHSEHVFGTQRESNHASGRAVDIWQVDGTAVVSQQPATDTPAHALARTVFDRGIVPELGSPWSFDGPGGRSFENDVHRDHLHVAFYA